MFGLFLNVIVLSVILSMLGRWCMVCMSEIFSITIAMRSVGEGQNNNQNNQLKDAKTVKRKIDTKISLLTVLAFPISHGLCVNI